MTLKTSDLFTEEEYSYYAEIVKLKNRIESKDGNEDKEKLFAEKKELSERLKKLIDEHGEEPRQVRLASVLINSKFKDDEGNYHLPAGVSWYDLKLSKRIAEFESEESRMMGLSENEITFDKIVIQWSSLEILHQICLYGFTMPLLMNDGTVFTKEYRMYTASAGQLRRDKITCISKDMWQKIGWRLECGLPWERINEQGGIVVNKILAYSALASSATDPWKENPIDNIIVVPDLEAPVTGEMMYINPDYSYKIGEYTVIINHIDGAGMCLPSVSKRNVMLRGHGIKGLLSPFDFIKFCEVHNVEPVVTDIYGKKHNLIEENITIILSSSQFKLGKYYKDFEEYKMFFKQCGRQLCLTNYEEDYIPDAKTNYQFLNALVDFKDDEIEKFIAPTQKRLNGICEDKNAMLKALSADEESAMPYKRALAIYPELLREAYSKESLKSIKKRWTLDAQSGVLKCHNKRLYVIPDLYAYCEFIFLGIKEPKGLLKNGEVACKTYIDYDEVDCLRSPSLYMEHSVRKVCHDPEVYKWFTTQGIYTSTQDLISRILQFDCEPSPLQSLNTVNRYISGVTQLA